jgi:tetratricopeptide (TPR) repeat protein
LIGALSPGLLLDLLYDLQDQRRSGLLHLIQAGSFRSLRFRSGQIVHGISSVPEEHMGEVLVRDGLLDREQLERATRVVLGERRRLGQVLLEQGTMDRLQLEEALARHGREVLLRAFEERSGSFTFEDADSERSEPDELTLRVPTDLMVLEVGRGLHDREALAFALGDLDRALARSEDPLRSVEFVPLEPLDAQVLSRVDGRRSAADIVASMGEPSERTLRSVFALLCAGVVRRRRPACEPARSAAADGGAESGAETIRSAEAMVAEGRPSEAIELLEGMLPAAESHSGRRARLLLAQVFRANPSWARRAEEPLAELVQSDPGDVEAAVALASLYRDTGRGNRAVALFRRVLDLQPDHAEATASLRALASQAADGAPPAAKP